jgi:CD109 antigen
MNFPETWLWTELTAGLDGSATLKATVPDTITSWVLSAFAVSPDVGLGIAPNLAKLTVFKPFFVSVNIPYSIIRGERFVAQVTVFNYLSTTVQAVVTLQESEYFVVRMDNDILPASQTVTATVKVSSNDAASVYFWIIPQTLGQIPIEVKATSGMAADAVEVMLLVEPEGVSQEYSTSVFFSLSAGQTADTTLNISIPANFVPGSEYFQVTAIGTLLGQSLNGLGNLLQMPYGCGEQNMLTFAPDVYVLKYLQITGQDGGSIAKDAREYIGAGYQRELTFQRLDGSFSAFGNSDPAGSVWLSAFVIKCFHEAKQFVIVDDGKIAVTLNWLANLQAANGSFSEPPNGRVIHTDMQGGSAGGVPLTAYVLISLMENADNSQVTSLNFTTARAKAIRYLESQLSLVTSDPYALSIITYALTLANSSQAETAFGYLNALAVNKDGLKYWHKPSDVPTYSDNMLWHPPYEQARSVDIEMTAYALLTYTVRRDFGGGVAIAKWIASQRNSLGGFSSTQDTVVALQALSTFATLTSGGSGSGGAQNLLIRLTASSLSYQFSITATNSLVLQSVQIPTNATKVSLHVTGTGVGLVQLNVKYNVRGEDSKKRRKRAAVEAAMTGATSIQLQVNNVQTDDKHIALNVCVRWFGNSSSGMAIIEIGLPTGYTADNVDDLKNQAGGLIRRVDSGTTSLVLYLDEFTTNSTCVNVLLTKVRIVDNIQPAIVTAYLYYDPGQRDTLEYQPTPSNVTYCDQCPQCCGCRLASSKCEILAKSVAAAQQLATLKLSCLATLAVIVLATKLQLSF